MFFLSTLLGFHRRPLQRKRFGLWGRHSRIVRLASGILIITSFLYGNDLICGRIGPSRYVLCVFDKCSFSSAYCILEKKNENQAMRTPSRDATGIALLYEYYNQLYYFERRFFSPERSLGVFFEWYIFVLYWQVACKRSNLHSFSHSKWPLFDECVLWLKNMGAIARLIDTFSMYSLAEEQKQWNFAFNIGWKQSLLDE